MHPTQKKLLALSQTQNLAVLGLREVGRMIGEPHPQKVKYHLQKLGLLSNDKKKAEDRKNNPLMSIPLMGLANCGEATIFAEPNTEQYLQVSKKFIDSNNADSLFAVKAVGDSMNRAEIKGKSIEDGDYVVIDSENKDFKNGDYILSILNGMANIKKFMRDDSHRQIILISESSNSYPPIFIHEQDFEHYTASGKVVSVLKGPSSFLQETVS